MKYKIAIIIGMIIFMVGCSNYDEKGFNQVTKRNWHSMGYTDKEGYNIKKL